MGRRDFLMGELEVVIRARNGSQPLTLDKSPHPSLPQFVSEIIGLQEHPKDAVVNSCCLTLPLGSCRLDNACLSVTSPLLRACGISPCPTPQQGPKPAIPISTLLRKFPAPACSGLSQTSIE